MSALAVGTPVRLTAFPGTLRRFTNVPGAVHALHPLAVDVLFEGEAEPVAVLPAYLTRQDAKMPRRSPLTLRAPQDDRTEAERQAEGVSWLRSLGYRVIETDTHRGGATCGKCSRAQKRKVMAACPICHAPCWSPTTGADAGLEDTSVQHPRWPGRPVPSMPVEWKRGPRAPRRPAQIERERLGEIVIAWDRHSLAAAAVVEFERGLGIAPLAEVEAQNAGKCGSL